MLKQNILIVAPHPDDETLGCGGTILKLKKMGCRVSWLILTNIFEKDGYSAQRVKARQKEIKKVSQLYNFDEVFNLGFPAAKIELVPMEEIIMKVKTVFKVVTPDTLFIHHMADAHSDHRVSFSAIMSCTKVFRAEFIKNIYSYETISETEFAAPTFKNAFIPTTFSDISPFLEKKIKIMKVYKSELGPHPFPRSVENIRAIATFRGAMCGVKYAEAFMTLRQRI